MKRKNKGFSMVELIIVIAIMAILAAALAPALIKYVRKSRRARDVDAAKEIYNGYARGVIAMDQDEDNDTGYGSGVVYVRYDTILNDPPQNLEDYAFEELGGVPQSSTFKDYYWKIEYSTVDGKVNKISLTPGSGSATEYELFPNGETFVDQGT